MDSTCNSALCVDLNENDPWPLMAIMPLSLLLAENTSAQRPCQGNRSRYAFPRRHRLRFGAIKLSSMLPDYRGALMGLARISRCLQPSYMALRSQAPRRRLNEAKRIRESGGGRRDCNGQQAPRAAAWRAGCWHVFPSRSVGTGNAWPRVLPRTPAVEVSSSRGGKTPIIRPQPLY